MELYHNKALFDAFNEALDIYRPYGLKGAPYDWKLSKECNPKIIEEEDVSRILQNAKEKVLEWCSTTCGFLGTTVEIPGQGMVALNEEQLERYKEENLTRMISKEVIKKTYSCV